MTIAELREAYLQRKPAIQERLADFAAVWATGDDWRLFEELVYCIFTAGASARMGLNCVERVRPLLLTGSHAQLTEVLLGQHRYPAARAGYIVHTREYLQSEIGLKLRAQIVSLNDFHARRDFFAANPGIKGIGYKEASHYLRNIGLRGYAILDKHILRSLHEFEVLDAPKPPGTRRRYLELEEVMRQFARRVKIDFDELDLLLWSLKTGQILK